MTVSVKAWHSVRWPSSPLPVEVASVVSEGHPPALTPGLREGRGKARCEWHSRRGVAPPHPVRAPGSTHKSQCTSSSGRGVRSSHDARLSPGPFGPPTELLLLVLVLCLACFTGLLCPLFFPLDPSGVVSFPLFPPLVRKWFSLVSSWCMCKRIKV